MQSNVTDIRAGRFLDALPLALLLTFLAATDGLATPSIRVMTPSLGATVGPTPLIRVQFSASSGGAPLDIPSLQITANGVDLTSRFSIGSDGAEYAVPVTDPLVAGDVTIAATIRDTGGETSIASVAFIVRPRLVSVGPQFGRAGTEIVFEVVGLDPDPSRNRALFAPCISVPFTAVDRATGRARLIVPPSALSGPVAVEVNGKRSTEIVPLERPHGLALGSGGQAFVNFSVTERLYSWGYYGSAGQLGFPTTSPVTRPTLVDVPPEPSDLVSRPRMSAGAYEHSLLLQRDGSLFGFGLNDLGQTGTGLETEHVRTPTRVLFPAGTPGVAMIDADIAASYAMTCDGQVWSWGWNGVSELGIGEDAVLIHPLPLRVLDNVRQFSAGEAGVLALRNDGSVWGWGWNYHFQAGDGGGPKASPGRITQLDGLNVVAVSGGGTHSLALLADGTVLSWGSNNRGQIGTYPPPVFPPVPILGLSDIVAIEAGYWHSLALRRDGKVLAWGQNRWGEAGGTAGVRVYPAREVLGLPPIVSIMAGVDVSAAVAEDGSVWTWGSGPLGDGTQASTATPIRLSFAVPDSLAVSTSTTRWKAQQSDAPIKVVFKGPTDMDLTSVKLEVAAPEEIGTYAPVIGLAKLVQDKTDEYEFEWRGPWTYSMLTGATIEQVRLPFGNYKLTVKGKKNGSSLELTSPTYEKVSLVEVKTIEIRAVSGGAPLDNNPAVDRHPEEPETNRVNRPGGGWRAYAEAATATGPVEDEVEVIVTIAPLVPEAVSVELRLMDVDDPDGAPIDKDGDAGATAADNNGTGVIAESVIIAADSSQGVARVTLSHQPGDNFRVAASTSRAYVDSLTAAQPSLVGEVREPNGKLLRQDEQVSKMITVWRHLNLEMDSMAPPPTSPSDAERNFVEGTVTRIESDNAGASIRVYVNANSPPEMTQLRDGSTDLNDRNNIVTGGNGRFENGQITLGGQAGVAIDNLKGNGIDYVEGHIEISATLLAGDGSVLVTGLVVSGEPESEKANFRFRPLSAGSFSTASRLKIGGSSWQILPGGVGPLTELPGGFFVADILTEPNRSLPFRLVDDDAISMSLLPDASLVQDSDSPMDNVFAAAYLRPQETGPGLRVPPFNRNSGTPNYSKFGIDLTEIFLTWILGRDLPPSSAPFQVAYVTGAFQPNVLEDGDPTNDFPFRSVTAGLTLVGKDQSQIYVETLGEQSTSRIRSLAVPHEIAHQLGRLGESASSNIMSQFAELARPFFTGPDLRQMRERIGKP